MFSASGFGSRARCPSRTLRQYGDGAIALQSLKLLPNSMFAFCTPCVIITIPTTLRNIRIRAILRKPLDDLFRSGRPRFELAKVLKIPSNARDTRTVTVLTAQ